ncbi:hypothetical protein PFISCL1PPCAC_27729, partial [Pristionchus fissidentatus]
FSLRKMRLLVFLVFFLSLIIGCTSLCGLRDSKFDGQRFKRIIGGEKVTKVGEWPWQVALQKFDSKSVDGACGGTVIADRWILTAAHCVYERLRKSFDFRIAAGALRWTAHVNSEQAVFINVTRFFLHPEVESSKLFYMTNDIALLELESPLRFNEIVSPVCLPSRMQRIPRDKNAVAIGYGLYEEPSFKNSYPSDGVLRETKIPIIPRDECKATLDEVNPYGIKYDITDAHICAGAAGHGVSYGDSGGPLMVQANDGRWFQFGIVTSGVRELILAQDIAPAIFANVIKFCDWLEDTTNGEAKCEKEEVSF